MSAIYSKASICPYQQPNCSAANQWTLDPEIEHVMSTSQDYDELAYVWKEWRDKSGKLMRQDYRKYVEIMNKAGKVNGL